MSSSAWPWLIGAGSALAGGVLALWAERQGAPRRRFMLYACWVALAAAVAGLGWRALEARAWPGVSPADALALLAGGGLAVAAWLALHGGADGRSALRGTALGASLIAAAAVLGAAAVSAQVWPAPPLELSARLWPLGLRNLLASVGLGGWLPALAASASWYVQNVTNGFSGQPAQPAKASSSEVDSNSFSGGTNAEATSASERAILAVVRPAEDPGRRAALFSFPWLTAACLAGGVWNLVAYGTIGRAVPADLWLLATWLLGGAYLHVTSSWQPLRLPGWLAPLMAAGVLVAAVLAASTAGSLR